MKHQQSIDIDTINATEKLGAKCLNPDKFVELENLCEEIRQSVRRRTSDPEEDMSVCHTCGGTGYTERQ